MVETIGVFLDSFFGLFKFCNNIVLCKICYVLGICCPGGVALLLCAIVGWFLGVVAIGRDINYFVMACAPHLSFLVLVFSFIMACNVCPSVRCRRGGGVFCGVFVVVGGVGRIDWGGDCMGHISRC